MLSIQLINLLVIMGIKGLRLAKKDVIDAIHLKKGIIAYAAALLDCERQTIYNWQKEDPDVAAAIIEARETGTKERLDMHEEFKDLAHISTRNKLAEGDLTMTIFIMKTLGGLVENGGNTFVKPDFRERPYRNSEANGKDNNPPSV